MSPKKSILSALHRAHEENGGHAYVRPSTIPGFSAAPDRFQKAVNELLRDRLIEGRKDTEGHMVVALNAHRVADVRRRLRLAWALPSLWALVLALGAFAAGMVMSPAFAALVMSKMDAITTL
jgi:hypothetical protein